jgi:pimeloyl-ACP methyl ester carboxylesterase
MTQGPPARAVARISGDAGPLPQLVLLHGAGGSSDDWPPELRSLPGRRVLAVDLPGHGAALGPAPRSIGSLAAAVEALLDASGVAQAAVAGHSMGGAVALSLALSRPERVAALVLVATGARLRVAPELLAAAASPDGLAVAAGRLADRSFGPAASAEARDARARAMAALPAGVLHGDLAACDAFDVMDRLVELGVPTVVVCGTEDRLTPPRYASFLAERIAGARLVLVPGAGHLVMLEEPRAVAAAIAALPVGPDGRRATP